MKRMTAVIATIFATMMTGCVSEEQIQAARQAADTVVSETQIILTEARSERDDALSRLAMAEVDLAASVVAGNEFEAAAAKARVDGNAAFISSIETAISAADKTLETAIATRDAFDNWQSGGAAGFIDSVGSTVLPFLPPGSQGPIVAILGVAGLVTRLIKKSKALNSLAESTVKLANRDSNVAEALAANADMMRRTQTKSAAKAIKVAKNGGFNLSHLI